MSASETHTSASGKRAEYIIPKVCEECGSENVAVRVIYDTGIVRYVCLDCGGGRSLAKQENLKRRTNTPLSNWAKRTIKGHPSCVVCGSTANLEAHHIIPVSHSRRHMYEQGNGVTLCKACHWLAHHKEADERNEL